MDGVQLIVVFRAFATGFSDWLVTVLSHVAQQLVDMSIAYYGNTSRRKLTATYTQLADSKTDYYSTQHYFSPILTQTRPEQANHRVLESPTAEEQTGGFETAEFTNFLLLTSLLRHGNS